MSNNKTPEIEKYRAELAELTPYATEYRYPRRLVNQEDLLTFRASPTIFYNNSRHRLLFLG